MLLARNVSTVGIVTLLSSGVGFVRDLLIAALFGATQVADAFVVSFQIPNLARRLLAEGGLNGAFVPLYVRAGHTGGPNQAAVFAGHAAGALAIVMAALAIAMALAMPAVIAALAPGFENRHESFQLAVNLARIMLPYLVLAAVVATLIGMLNANHRFAAAAFAAFVYNAVLVTTLAWLLWRPPTDKSGSAYLLASSLGLAGLAQFVLLAIAIWRARIGVGPVHVSAGREMRHFFMLAIPGLIAHGVPQFTLIIGVMLASAEARAVSWLYYANRLAEFPLGIVGVAIASVLIPIFAHAVQNNDRNALVDAESRGLELAAGLALPAAIALCTLSDLIVRALFEHGAFTRADTVETAKALAAFAFGLPGYVLVKAVASIFFARADTLTPMCSSLAGFATTLAGGLILQPLLGHVGIALAIALSSWINAAILTFILARNGGISIDRAARRRLPKIVIAASLMGIAILALSRIATVVLPESGGLIAPLAVLAALIASGLLVYIVLLWALGVVQWSELLAVIPGMRLSEPGDDT